MFTLSRSWNQKIHRFKNIFHTRIRKIFPPRLVYKLKTAPKEIIERNEPYPSYVVFHKIFVKDEIAPGHEGIAFGIWLRSNDYLKFTAIETIP